MRSSLLLVAFSLACARGEVRVQKDIAYLDETRAEKVDVYLPPENHPAPAVLLIHGGGWTGGDKADKRGESISSTLSAAGYAVFAINYQLAHKEGDTAVWKGAWPQNVYDCKSALRFMRKEAKRFGIDPNRIAVMGESAGGHLALLLGSTAHVDDLNHGGLYTDQRNTVKCIVDFYGVPDLTDSFLKGLNGPFKGATEQETAANIRRASPVNYIDAKVPPMLIVHGTMDKTVPIETSQRLVDRLQQLGAIYQFVEVPGAGHSFNLQPKEMDLRPVVLDFLKKFLQ